MLDQFTSRLWAKTARRATGSIAWHPLPHHLIETAAVGWVLWEQWCSKPFKERLSAWLGAGEQDARSLVSWLCGAHDTGKASGPFQWRVPELARRLPGAAEEPPPAGDLPHNMVSGLAVRSFAKDRWGWPERPAEALGELAVGHHGSFALNWVERAEQPELVGGRWEEARRALSAMVADLAGLRRPPPPPGPLDQATRLALAGLVTLADWLASNEAWFPYDGLDENLSPISPEALWQRGLDRARRAVTMALGADGAPWRPAGRGGPGWVRELLEERFGLGKVRPLQQAAAELAAKMDGPGILLIEGPTGEGKTEAALLAAEIMASRFSCTGIFFGLPTRATGNQMFGRVHRWLASQPGQHVLALLHGKAQLEPAYRRLLTQRASAIGIDVPPEDSGAPGDVVATEWLAGRKRGLLSQFAVGTVDQLLFAVLAARYVSLRHLGTVGKVICIDEVHAYDAYTSVFLRQALRWLGEQGTPVILLSATLTAQQRGALVEAYVGGRAPALRQVSRYPGVLAVWGPKSRAEGEGASPTRRVRGRAVRRSANARVVQMTLAPEPEEDDRVVADFLVDRLAEGGCAVVVRNTVRRAQRTFRVISPRFGPGEVMLFHSRFVVADRQRIEAELQRDVGPPPDGGRRPHRLVLIATQVVEQSLDVDFDLLVSDLAPVDLLLQRLGRTHRHPREGRPSRLAEPSMVVVGWWRTPDSPCCVPAACARVYTEHTLVRTWAALRDWRDGCLLCLPEDTPHLLERVYGPLRHDPPDLAPRLAELLSQEKRQMQEMETDARRWALGAPRPGWRPLRHLFPGATFGQADEDSPVARAAVRSGEPGVEVVLCSREGNELVVGNRRLSGGQVSSAEDAEAILREVVALPPFVQADALVGLGQPPSWANHPWLRHLRPLPLDGGEARLGRYKLRYTSVLGLEVEVED